MDTLIGVTEGADPTCNLDWKPWIAEGKPAIIITKKPRLLINHITGKENIIVHCTITGLGGSIIEPFIDYPEVSLKYYHELCKRLGKDRVVLRIDPIILLSEELYSTLPEYIIKEAEGRVRISFLDMYNHVKTRFREKLIELPYTTFDAPFERRVAMWQKLGKPETCGEAGLPSTPCVSAKDCEVLGVVPSLSKHGQRAVCGCLANKFELLKHGTCTYKCLYCYWRN